MRYVCRFFKVINPENRLEDFPDPTPIKADARLRYSIITHDRAEGLGGELGPCLMIFPILRKLAERILLFLAECINECDPRI
jgi:hypothetical protein